MGVANVGPALLGWVLVIMPADQAREAHQDVGVAYMLVVSPTLALGPLLGLSQAVVLRAYTPRWPWWIAANLLSWLIVDLVVVLINTSTRSISATVTTRSPGST